MNRSLKHTLLALMFTLTPIGAKAEEYDMGDPVTITITVVVDQIVDIEELCAREDAPPECNIDAQVPPEPEVTKEP